MLTKIKKDLKNVTWFGWVTLAVAVVALWFALNDKPHRPGHGPKAPAVVSMIEKGGNGPTQPKPAEPAGEPGKPGKPGKPNPKFLA